MTVDRFVEAQKEDYERAYGEILAGEKRSCWMWYIFPQLKGLGRSYMSDYYGIDGRAEAEEYWADPYLRGNLLMISEALLQHTDKDIRDIMGFIDDMKLRSSMTLFEAVGKDPVFSKVLDSFFGGERDPLTLSMLNEDGPGVRSY